MTALAIACVFFTVLSSTAVVAQPAPATQPPSPPSPTTPPSAGDVEQALLLDDSRPMVLRFEIGADGKGFHAHRREFVETLFAYLDQDGDGALAGKEITRSNAWRSWMAVNQPQGPGAKPPTAPNGAAATPSPEAKVARDEWIKALAGAGEGARFDSQSATAISSQPMWGRLDRDADGKLDVEELASAASTLAPLDTNEDEMIAAEELTPYQPALYGTAAPSGTPGAAAAMPLARDDSARKMQVRELFRRYDRPGRGGKVGNRKLESQEVQLEPPVFGKADGDHDGALDRAELLAWLRDPAVDLAVAVNFGDGPGALAVTPLGEGLPREVARHADGSQTIAPGRLRLHFEMAETRPHTADDEFLEGQFRAADRDASGELDAAECQILPYLKDEFEFLDRNRDGKLSLDEAIPFFRQQDGLASCQFTILVFDQGRVLYSAIDADHDGRLSVRELRAAGAKFSLWDANGDGRLSEDEVPHQVRITIQRGMRIDAAPGQPAAPNGTAPVNVAGRAGPRWFRRMDRNGDGDVSPREFLLGDEPFTKLDADGDGLIDASEADRITQEPAPATPKP